MKVNTLTLNDSGYPEILREIHSPPNPLFYRGEKPSNWLNKPKVAVVGSRKMTSYGKAVTQKIVGDLARVGVVIVSGLAYGIDATAHQAALDAGGITVAVLPTPVQQIYPAAHANLAQRIIEHDGALLSEYPEEYPGYKINFISRNRIVSGLADILLITEAALKSGSLHTARFALEQGKTVMAVPGSILGTSSEGCNNLIKSGAIPVTSSDDIFFALKIQPAKAKQSKNFQGTAKERQILGLIIDGCSAQEELALVSGFDGPAISSTLTSLELGGYIRPAGAGNWLAT